MEAVNKGHGDDFERGVISRGRSVWRRLRYWRIRREGTTAFLEKRAAGFKGSNILLPRIFHRFTRIKNESTTETERHGERPGNENGSSLLLRLGMRKDFELLTRMLEALVSSLASESNTRAFSFSHFALRNWFSKSSSERNPRVYPDLDLTISDPDSAAVIIKKMGLEIVEDTRGPSLRTPFGDSMCDYLAGRLSTLTECEWVAQSRRTSRLRGT